MELEVCTSWDDDGGGGTGMGSDGGEGCPFISTWVGRGPSVLIATTIGEAVELAGAGLCLQWLL